MFCPNCDNEVSDQMKYCGICGEFVGIENSKEKEELHLFVGRNAKYYLKKWEKVSQPHRMSGWNWAAFFLPIFWLAYRKIYKHMFIILGLGILVNLAFVEQDGYGAIILLFGASIAVYYGLKGNAIYYIQAKKKINRIKKVYSEVINQKIVIAKSGDVNWILVIMIIIFFLINIAGILYYAVNEMGYPKDTYIEW